MGDPQPVVDAEQTAESLPAVTETEVRRLTDGGSFARGQQYQQQSAIFTPYRRGRTLRAMCHGSSGGPYSVSATLAAPGATQAGTIVSWSCTCPRGGFCKHVVALLLTWLATPDDFDVRPTIDTILADQSREDLIGLIRQMLKHDPTLESLVDRLRGPAVKAIQAAQPGEANVRTVNVAKLRRQVVSLFTDVAWEHDDYYRQENGFPEIAPKLAELRDLGSGYVEAGRLADAIAVYATVAEEAMAHFEDVYEDEGIFEVVLNCGGGLLRCLERQPALAAEDRLPASERAALVDTLYEIWQFGGDSPAWVEPAHLEEDGEGDSSDRWGDEWTEDEDDEDDEEEGEDTYDADPRAIGEAATADDGFDVEGALAGVLTDAERRALEGRLRESIRTDQGYGAAERKRSALRFIFRLKHASGASDEEMLAEYQDAELWDDATDLLLKMGRIEDAVAVASRRLTEPGPALAFANRLVALGGEHGQRAIAFIDGRLWETEGVRPDVDLAYLDWLSGRYATEGMAKQAFDTDLRRFKRRPDDAHYLAVQSTATLPGQDAGLWERTRPDLLAELTRLRHWSALIDIYLKEGQVADAVATLKRAEEKPSQGEPGLLGGGYGHGWWDAAGYRQRVAKAAETEFPDESIRLYRILTDRAITMRNRQAYQVAANHLGDVRRLYEATGRVDEWRRLITTLREEHKRLRALREELDVLGLA